MAVPPFVMKLAVTAATDKRTWKIIGVLIAAALAPIIIAVMLLGSIVSSVDSANKKLLDHAFKGESITEIVTSEELEALQSMRTRLENLSAEIEKFEGSLDEDLVKAVFYCLNFSTEFNDENEFDYGTFIECFEEMSLGDFDEILSKLNEKFPQYENSEELKSDVETVYIHLKEG